MRFSSLCLASGFLGLAVPQSTSIVTVAGLPINISGLPTCAQSCLANSTGAADGCSITDIHCLCSSITYINELSCCLERSCSTNDQSAALRFDISLCAQYNINIPDFIGCSPLQNQTGVSYTSVAPTQLSSFISVVASVAASASTITAVGAAYTATGSAPITTYDGRALLTGSCTSPTILSYVPTAGPFVEYPWIGCQPGNAGCCPFDPSSPGPLAVCPSDYITTASGCCPSGWSVYSTALYGSQTPCYSSPSQAYAAATIPTPSQSGSTPSIVANEVFALHYALSAPDATRLSSGAIGGIAVGAVAGSAAVGAVLLLLRRRYQRHTHLRREASTVRTPTTAAMSALNEYPPATPSTLSPTTPRSKHSGAPGAAPSPPASPRPELPTVPLGGVEWSHGVAPRAPPVEMPGSMFMHEHHPFYQASSPAAGFGHAAPARSVPSPGGSPEVEVYRPPFASVERISDTYLRAAPSP